MHRNKTHAGLLRQACNGPLAEPMWSVEGRDVCILHKRLADDVHGEALGRLDIACCVLHVVLCLMYGDTDEWRAMRYLVGARQKSAPASLAYRSRPWFLKNTPY